MKLASLSALVLASCSFTAASSPVEKIVALLGELKEKVQSDGKTEQQIYDKYACWCETTSAKKAGAIETAQSDLRSLGQTILKLKGSVAVLTQEISEHAEAIAANEAEQEEATNLRQKENQEFAAETSELKQAIVALQNAVQVLSAGTAAEAAVSFSQQQGRASHAVRAVLQKLPTSGRRLKAEHLALLAKYTTESGGRYAPQSLTVQGILRDMYDTFVTDLESATSEEATANRQFEDFIAIKSDEHSELSKTKAAKENEKAMAESNLADTTQSYDDTERQMHADTEFFDATKAACEAKHAEWTTRSTLRAEELSGIVAALEILTSDSAREYFNKAIKAGKETKMDAAYDSGIDIGGVALLQVNAHDAAMVSVANAYALMRTQARKTHSLRLAAVAAQVREAKVGHFDAVLKAIEEMIKSLKEEDAADIAKRDQCKEEYTKSASKIANITWLIEKNEAQIDKLAGLIELRTTEKEAAIAAINETQQQIDGMTAQRHEEHEAFKHAKADDEASLHLLIQARDVLMSYYKSNAIDLGPIQGNVKDLALAQHEEPIFDVSEDQAPDADFSGKGSRKAESKDIVSIMTYLIQDLNDEISNGLKDEDAAQTAFEKELKAAENLVTDLTTKKTNLETAIGKLQEAKVDEGSDMEENKVELKDETEYKAKITPDCDWIIGTFEERANKRAAEMSGLVGAKEFLAGQNGKPALIQNRHAVTTSGSSLRRIRFLGLGA